MQVQKLRKCCAYATKFLFLVCLSAGCDKSPPVVETKPNPTPEVKATPGPEAEAVAAIDAEITAHWLQLGDSWFTMNPAKFVQERGVSRQVTITQLTDSDQLNGIEVAGAVEYKSKSVRWHESSGWSQWVPANAQMVPFFAKYSFKKTSGKWEYEGGWYWETDFINGPFSAPSKEVVEAMLKPPAKH